MGPQHLGVELLFLVEVSVLKPLAVNLVNLVKLQSWLWVERGKRKNCLSCQSATVYEEQDALCNARLHEAVDFVHHRECLPRSCRHRNEHLLLAFSDGLLDSRICFSLVRTEFRMLVRHSLETL